MANTYTKLLVHAVFSTKEREPWLKPDVLATLLAYMGGIARDKGFTLLCAGGMADHVHVLLSLPTRMPLSDAIQSIKGASSRWVHETRRDMASFAWQEGYGAFTIGVSQVADTRAYIEKQAEHHRKMNFQEEYLAFLRKNDVEYDMRYVWG